MMNLKDKDTRRLLANKYLDAETSPGEEALLASYYAENMAEDDETEIASLILSSSTGLDSVLDAGDSAFKGIMAAEATRSRRRRIIRSCSCFASAACVAVLVLLFHSKSVNSDRAKGFADVNSDEAYAAVSLPQVEDAPQELPKTSSSDPERAKASIPSQKKIQNNTSYLAENSPAPELRFEDIFSSRIKSTDSEQMLEIEDELDQILLEDDLEKEVNERIAINKAENEIKFL